MDTFIQQILNGLVLGSMYALIALGYTMVYGVLNLINFAHGDVLMIGAMVGLSILKLLDAFFPGLPGYVDLFIAIAGAVPACMLVNVIIERVAYRRLRNAHIRSSIDYLQIYLHVSCQQHHHPQLIHNLAKAARSPF